MVILAMFKGGHFSVVILAMFKGGHFSVVILAMVKEGHFSVVIIKCFEIYRHFMPSDGVKCL